MEKIMNDWIPVSERLPEKYGDYLAYSQGTGVAWMVFNYNKEWISGDEYIRNTTHWMPLPEPPEDGHEP